MLPALAIAIAVFIAEDHLSPYIDPEASMDTCTNEGVTVL